MIPFEWGNPCFVSPDAGGPGIRVSLRSGTAVEPVIVWVDCLYHFCFEQVIPEW